MYDFHDMRCRRCEYGKKKFRKPQRE